MDYIPTLQPPLSSAAQPIANTVPPCPAKLWPPQRRSCKWSTCAPDCICRRWSPTRRPQWWTREWNWVRPTIDSQGQGRCSSIHNKRCRWCSNLRIWKNKSWMGMSKKVNWNLAIIVASPMVDPNTYLVSFLTMPHWRGKSLRANIVLFCWHAWSP